MSVSLLGLGLTCILQHCYKLSGVRIFLKIALMNLYMNVRRKYGTIGKLRLLQVAPIGLKIIMKTPAVQPVLTVN